MSRYKDADLLIDEMCDGCDSEACYGMPNSNLNKCYSKRLIEEAPIADVVEVVRCKDCKNWGKPRQNNDAVCYVLSRFGSFYTYGRQWCCFGERREVSE